MIKFRMLHPHTKVPTKGTPDATGYDLYSTEEVLLGPGERAAIGTGLQLELNLLAVGIELQIRPRSGLAIKHGVTVLNSPGTIDRDYQGEVKVILINHSTEPYTIRIGDRIAQLVLGRYLPETLFFPIEELSENTKRGTDGFGSTGK